MRAIRGPEGFATRKLMKSSILWTKKYTSDCKHSVFERKIKKNSILTVK
jgi:hypothetical protein